MQSKARMDSESSWQQQHQQQQHSDREIEEAPDELNPEKKKSKKSSNAVARAVLITLFMTVPLVILLGGRTSSPAVWIRVAKSANLGQAKDFYIAALASLGIFCAFNLFSLGSQDGYFTFSRRGQDKLLGGLLAAGFDERSCLSRYQSVLYRKKSAHVPSTYLVERLRKHEALQKKCGPNTNSYEKAVEQLKSGKINNTTDCKYIVSISYRGLGNRILAAASAFLYAVLTDRVLLIDRSNDMDELFCEPFPETSWLLPLDFPLTDYRNFSLETEESYGNMLKNKVISNDASQSSSAQMPAFAYIHHDHDFSDYDKFFYCDEDQRLLRNIPWLVMRTDSYIVPGLFLVSDFQDELARLFPEKETVYHHVGRYLFHPRNSIWGLITRYYRSYLAQAQQRVGIQVRVFGADPPLQHVLDQILACTNKEKLLPEITAQEPVTPSSTNFRAKAVLITSLKSWYYENIKSMYWEHPTANGEVVSVYQPSHEEYQHFGARSHDAKAWAEIYLLSLTDVLVTSGWSTFGYVAQGLGGLRPWIMFRPENRTVPDPPCGRAMSMEPCFHSPLFYDCKAKTGADTGKMVPHVRHCEDVSWGLKLVHRNEW